RAAEAPATPALLLAWAAAGLAGVAVAGGSLVIGQCAGGLAVAAGVFSAAAVFVPRIATTAAAAVGGTGLWVVLAGATLVLTDTPPLALAVLPLVFWADVPVRALRGGTAGPVGALLTTLLALPVVVAAVWLVAGLRPEQGLYYQ
ncbi:MAG: hypothetical protein KDJ16_01975, partial [Hyphomicrobiales bacterium]|nr:hypothetical protein [Hyphomicrobiales bacterium]